MKLVIQTDGACPGNPGPMGIGVVIRDGTKIIKEISKNIGIGTNNKAEYNAVIIALKEAKKLKADEVEIISDSNLLVKQLRGEWKVKDKELKRLFEQVKTLEKDFEKINYRWVARNNNKEADSLANKYL